MTNRSYYNIGITIEGEEVTARKTTQIDKHHLKTILYNSKNLIDLLQEIMRIVAILREYIEEDEE